MLGQNLRQLCESEGHAEVTRKLGVELASGRVRPEQFSLRELAESFLGHNWDRRLRAGAARHAPPLLATRGPDGSPEVTVLEEERDVTEAGDAVDVSAFSNIVGQIFFTKIMVSWTSATLVADALAENVDTKLDGEKIPFLGHVLGEGKPVHPGMPFPETGFGEHWIQVPPGVKYGQIVSVTWEAIFFDRTAKLLQQAGEAVARMGYGKEKRVLDAALGITNNYNLNGTTYQTFINSAGGAYVNAMGGLPLVDYTSLEQAYILASQILDPDTGEPLAAMNMKQLLVMQGKVFTAHRIVKATEVRSTYPGYSAGSPPPPGNVQTVSPNPLPDQLQVVTSPIAFQRLLAAGYTATQARDHWFVGDFKKAINYYRQLDFEATQAPPGHVKEFEQDIIYRIRGRERGVAAVVEPRAVMHFWGS